jgi:hypothetical protein
MFLVLVLCLVMVGERWSVELYFILIQCHPRQHEQVESDLLSLGSYGTPKFSKPVSAVYLFLYFFLLAVSTPMFFSLPSFILYLSLRLIYFTIFSAA